MLRNTEKVSDTDCSNFDCQEEVKTTNLVTIRHTFPPFFSVWPQNLQHHGDSVAALPKDHKKTTRGGGKGAVWSCWMRHPSM